MLPGARTPYGNPRPAPRWLNLVLVVLGLFILVAFIVDKVAFHPAPPTAAAVIDHLNRHDVRRVTIPAREVTVELNDGKTLTAAVAADRDLWPAIRRSGADVSIVAGGGASGEPSLIGYIFQFVPFVIMALLLLFILRTSTRGRAQ